MEATTRSETRNPLMMGIAVLVAVGLITFVVGLFSRHPERAWQAYLINFLLFSAIAQGGVLFSTIMHTVGARWSGPLSNLSEAFTAFFPVSFLMFLLLFLGSEHVFPWLHEDLHGKEVWLNLPFLFLRDLFGLLVLYGLGFAYLYHALNLKLGQVEPRSRLRALLHRRWNAVERNEAQIRNRMSVLAVLYMLAFAIVLSLIGFDLVMAKDPHWYSTLFGGYTFVKAIYLGLGAIIIVASILHLAPASRFGLRSNQFHDIGKLYFAFCLVWADFFYCQFVVIWYGNIPEETAYVIERVMHPPWQTLAWVVFSVCFIIPFFILLSKEIKTRPKAMIVICTSGLIGLWLEHLLLIGPALKHGQQTLPLGISDGLIFLGFLGMMTAALTYFLKLFPELLQLGVKEVR